MPLLNNENYLLDLLLKRGLINEQQRDIIIQKKHFQRQALLKRMQQKGSGEFSTDDITLVEIILSFHFENPWRKAQPLCEEDLMRLVAADLKLPFKKIDPLELDLNIVTKTIPKSFAVKHLVLPFSMREGLLEVAICDPDSRAVLEDIARANQLTVAPYISTKSEIKKTLAEFFGFQHSITSAETHLGRGEVDLGNLEQYVRIGSNDEIASSDQHIKSAVDHLFNYAFDQRASDIHIEPKRDKAVVRLRIDGVLHTIYTLPKVVHPAVISRIKSLSRLDIAEKRRPQDGRIKVAHGGSEAEIRVSTVPVAFGEKVVLRILDPEIIFQDLTKLGFCERDYKVYRGFLGHQHGIILVTGPTGSGKSTTLYSTLKSVATPELNIITVEDPVEMVHEEFNQIAVQPQVDVTFSTILRNILRQDPDIIMIGEIRDFDTAAHATQAALTGHLVFSTLHTNDAVTSITRLLDLGIQPFMISSTLLGAMAQRLVRSICPSCAENFVMEAEVLRGLGFPAARDGAYTLRRGKGCMQCRSTGYYGRNGVFELFSMSEKIKKLVSTSAPEYEIRSTAIKEGMTTLNDDAWRKVKDGMTTYEEAVRITGM